MECDVTMERRTRTSDCFRPGTVKAGFRGSTHCLFALFGGSGRQDGLDGCSSKVIDEINWTSPVANLSVEMSSEMSLSTTTASDIPDPDR